MAIEIVNWALRKLEAKITVFDVMAAVPIIATAAKICAASTFSQGGVNKAYSFMVPLYVNLGKMISQAHI